MKYHSTLLKSKMEVWVTAMKL